MQSKQPTLDVYRDKKQHQLNYRIGWVGSKQRLVFTRDEFLELAKLMAKAI